jgi:hypothetical protein
MTPYAKLDITETYNGNGALRLNLNDPGAFTPSAPGYSLQISNVSTGAAVVGLNVNSGAGLARNAIVANRLSSGNGSFTFYNDVSGTLTATLTTTGGNVGIGTTTPGSGTKLYVNGQIATASGSITTNAVDFSVGNAVTTSYDCASAFTLANVRNGGTYTLVVTGTGTTQCTFPSSTTGDDAASVTYKWQSANAVRTASTHTIYTLLRVGNIIYVSWATGFQ